MDIKKLVKIADSLKPLDPNSEVVQGFIGELENHGVEIPETLPKFYAFDAYSRAMALLEKPEIFLESTDRMCTDAWKFMFTFFCFDEDDDVYTIDKGECWTFWNEYSIIPDYIGDFFSELNEYYEGRRGGNTIEFIKKKADEYLKGKIVPSLVDMDPLDFEHKSATGKILDIQACSSILLNSENIDSSCVDEVNNYFDTLDSVDYGSVPFEQHALSSSIFELDEVQSYPKNFLGDEVEEVKSLLSKALREECNKYHSLNDLGLDPSRDSLALEAMKKEIIWDSMDIGSGLAVELRDFGLISEEDVVPQTTIQDIRECFVNAVSEQYFPSNEVRDCTERLHRFEDDAELYSDCLIPFVKEGVHTMPTLKKIVENVLSQLPEIDDNVAEDIDLDINDVDW